MNCNQVISCCIRICVISPVDLLVSPRNRFVYAVLFGIMGVALVNGFSDIDTSLPGDNIYLSTFNKMCKERMSVCVCSHS